MHLIHGWIRYPGLDKTAQSPPGECCVRCGCHSNSVANESVVTKHLAVVMKSEKSPLQIRSNALFIQKKTGKKRQKNQQLNSFPV